MPHLVKNVVPRRWRFLVTYKDGREEEVEVEAESYHVAVYALPRGKKSYKLLEKDKKEDK